MTETTLQRPPIEDDAGAAPAPERTRSGLLDRVSGLWNRSGIERRLAYLLMLLAAASGVGTYVAFASAGPAGPSPETVLVSLYLNLFLLLLLGALVAHRLVRLWAERRQGLAGARLHAQMVFLFAFVAVVPTIVVSVFSIVLFDFGIRSWFSERVGTAVDASQAVAERYLEEHRQTIRGDVLAMASDLNREASVLLNNPPRFAQVVSAQAALRNLTEAIVFDGTGRVLARTALSVTFEFEPIPPGAIQQARDGEVVIITEADDRMRALVKLENYFDTFLFVGRFVDADILAYIDQTREAVTQYQELEGRRFDIQVTFALIFGVVALLLLLAAVWVGLNFANRLARPVSALIDAAERVSAGDLQARVVGVIRRDELGMLSRAFNRMTRQLEAQRKDLIEAHRKEDTRRRFTEAVLEGVSSGVIGLDPEGRVNLPNQSAADLLGTTSEALLGRNLAEIVPELAALVDRARSFPGRRADGEIELIRGARTVTLLARISPEQSATETTGYVVTFDDITELQAAQRQAAWADVARRIAHEIKNPLTPIQLSAERLKRRYLKQIDSDPETFVECTDTIVRQVGDIGRMVDEFSAFARMPTAVMRPENLVTLLREQIFLQRSANPGIDYVFEPSVGTLTLDCDSRQIRQAVTNLLQNSADAIEGRARHESAASAPLRGRIEVRAETLNGQTVLEVADDGRGLPSGDDRHRLTEPYVTTREKGTGLGLAIVKKIMEDHSGRIEIDDRQGGGAVVRLIFSAPGSSFGDGGPVGRDPVERDPVEHEPAVDGRSAEGLAGEVGAARSHVEREG